MRKNDLVQVKNLSSKELLEKVRFLRKDIANLVLDKNTKKLKDLKSISKKRNDLAQVLTIVNQKEMLIRLESKVEELPKEKKVTKSKTKKVTKKGDNEKKTRK